MTNGFISPESKIKSNRLSHFWSNPTPHFSQNPKKQIHEKKRAFIFLNIFKKTQISFFLNRSSLIAGFVSSQIIKKSERPFFPILSFWF